MFNHYFVLPYGVKVRNGCASVLKTTWSNGNNESSENNKYEYFNVSARKKVSILSSSTTGTWLTFLMIAYLPHNNSNTKTRPTGAHPPVSTRACLSIACRIFQPQSRYFGLCVTRCNINKLSRVSGRSLLKPSAGFIHTSVVLEPSMLNWVISGATPVAVVLYIAQQASINCSASTRSSPLPAEQSSFHQQQGAN